MPYFKHITPTNIAYQPSHTEMTEGDRKTETFEQNMKNATYKSAFMTPNEAYCRNCPYIHEQRMNIAQYVQYEEEHQFSQLSVIYKYSCR